MSETKSQVDDRTETKRFTTEDAPFDATDLITGDRIETSLVARTMDLLDDSGVTWDQSATQLARATMTRHHDDIHRAILVDGETGLLVRASCHDSQSAWSQQEEDWKIREIGERITVDSVSVQHDPADEWTGDNITDMAADWANLVLQDKARGATGYEDELTLISGSTLKMRDPTPAVVHATIDIDGDGGTSEAEQ